MTEHPIIFSGEMVRAILDGRKTMTRRVVKLDDFDGDPVYETSDGTLRDVISLCPYGKVGDRLWVREAWGIITGKYSQRWKSGTVAYKADHGITHGGVEYDLMKWKPSIHMPRKASRITLEITKIRVERLQEITEEDVRKEGIDESKSIMGSRMGSFVVLWDSINGKKYPWSNNCFVWVLTFKNAHHRGNCQSDECFEKPIPTADRGR